MQDYVSENGDLRMSKLKKGPMDAYYRKLRDLISDKLTELLQSLSGESVWEKEI